MENKQDKIDKIAAILEEELATLISISDPHGVRVHTEAGRMIASFLPENVSYAITHFFATLLCVLHSPDSIPELRERFGASPSDANPEAAQYFLSEMVPIILRAADVYRDELEVRLKEAIEGAPVMACLRALCESEQQVGMQFSKAMGELEQFDRQMRVETLARWGVRDHRRPGTFRTMRELLNVYYEAIEGLEPNKITQEVVAERISKIINHEKYSPRQLQKDIDRFQEFGLKWKKGKGIVWDASIQE